MIPLEAARLGVAAHAIDYSPVAVLASTLLTDYPFRDWTASHPFRSPRQSDQLYEGRPRLLRDVETIFSEIGRRWATALHLFYPAVDGRLPWGYLWAITLPCQECGTRFPLVGSLRTPALR